MKLTATQRKQIKTIGDNHKLDFIVLHGSRATGKIISPKPDIDIAVYRRGGISFQELIDLNNEFMSVFKGEDVDIKTLHKKDPLFFYLTLRDSILLYGNRRQYNELKAYSYRRFIDAKPLFKLQDQLMNRGLDILRQAYTI